MLVIVNMVKATKGERVESKEKIKQNKQRRNLIIIITLYFGLNLSIEV